MPLLREPSNRLRAFQINDLRCESGVDSGNRIGTFEGQPILPCPHLSLRTAPRIELGDDVIMDLHSIDAHARGADDYLFGRGPAWFALVMTVGLMIFDYVDRQVIVSLFPHLKADWGPSDKELGALVSAVNVTVALGAIPVALFADRASRVKSIVVMAVIWSLASISSMFTRNYGQLLAARSVVGMGEAGYGSVGAALIASHFPARMRGALLAAFFASASVGSVLGVMLGGLIATKWAGMRPSGWLGSRVSCLHYSIQKCAIIEPWS